MNARAAPPLGQVTFLFTDMEGSTRLLQELGESEYATLLGDHHRLLRQAVREEGGYEVDTQGDALFVAFRSARDAVRAAARAQRALARHPWPGEHEVRVRMGILTGRGTWVGDRYVGLDVHRGARVAAAGHGGQVLVCDVTHDLLHADSQPGVETLDLGYHRLKDIASPERLHQLVLDGLPADFPPLRTLDPPANLPARATALVGRASELSELAALISESRLVTLTGPGGIGKTRLAVEVAATMLHGFRDGVFFVSLAAIDNPDLVPSAVARSVGLQAGEGGGKSESLADRLAAADLLLVLDNFEHVLPAASFVSWLVTTTSRVRILATSRSSLHVYGEREYELQPLSLPDEGSATVEELGASEAVTLFQQRARAGAPSFAVTAKNARAVAEIVRRVDGLPLAIELAAAGVKLLSPSALLDRLGARLDAQVGPVHGRPSRHQTLDAAIRWSYDLLDDDAKRAFARFAAFAGGAELAEVEIVCAPDGDAVALLAALVESSLVKRAERGGEPRFLMLRTIRDFALERLAERSEQSDVFERHGRAFLSLAEGASPHLTGAQARPWLDRLDAEHDNLAAAIRRSVEAGDAASSLGFVAALWRYWQRRGYLAEGRELAELVLGLDGIKRHPHELARALEATAGLAYWQGDFDAARARYEQALELQRRYGDDAGIANALWNLSFTYSVTQADPETAGRLVEESLALYRRTGDREGTAKSLFALGNVWYFQDRFESAREAYAESLELERGLGDEFSLGWALYMLALVEQGLGRGAEAARLYREAFEVFSSAGDVSAEIMCLNALADAALLDDDVVRAARLAGAAAALEVKSGAALASFAVRQEHRDGVAELRELAPEAWAEGEALGLEEAIGYVLDRSGATTE
jgi:predicted ATPase/class 3 adenylate cyclase